MYVVLVLCIRIHRTDSARTTTMQRDCDTALQSYLAAGRVARAWAAPQRSRTNPAPREVGSSDSLARLAGLHSKASSRARTCSGRKRRAASGRQRSVAEVVAPCFVVGVYMRQLEQHEELLLTEEDSEGAHGGGGGPTQYPTDAFTAVGGGGGCSGGQ
jgi:hypothetical protein